MFKTTASRLEQFRICLKKQTVSSRVSTWLCIRFTMKKFMTFWISVFMETITVKELQIKRLSKFMRHQMGSKFQTYSLLAAQVPSKRSSILIKEQRTESLHHTNWTTLVQGPMSFVSSKLTQRLQRACVRQRLCWRTWLAVRNKVIYRHLRKRCKRRWLESISHWCHSAKWSVHFHRRNKSTCLIESLNWRKYWNPVLVAIAWLWWLRAYRR